MLWSFRACLWRFGGFLKKFRIEAGTLNTKHLKEWVYGYNGGTVASVHWISATWLTAHGYRMKRYIPLYRGIRVKLYTAA